MEEKVRVMRILVYEGTRKWVENTLKRGSVPAEGIKVITDDGVNCIKSALIDKFPEVLETKAISTETNAQLTASVFNMRTALKEIADDVKDLTPQTHPEHVWRTLRSVYTTATSALRG